MRAAIITVAGKATRFNQNSSQPVLKCIYGQENGRTLLGEILYKVREADQIIIVGGYKFNELKTYLSHSQSVLLSKIDLIKNHDYESRGTGYSLYLGIKALKESITEAILIEGDLYFDEQSFQQVMASQYDVITINRDPIDASKTVVAYFDDWDRLHYRFSSDHTCIVLPGPIRSIYNSAQIWKFKDIRRLFDTVNTMCNNDLSSTNLLIIEKYFSMFTKHKLDIILIQEWVNCNTVLDYKRVFIERKTNEAHQ